jgi:cyclic-di-GMP-binding biofilm dispersal mediator protein
MKLSGKRVLVVGASGVLGGLIVDGLLRRGSEVWATASSLESAERINPAVKQRVVVDLTNQGSIDATAQYLNQKAAFDGVILAAGVVGFGTVADTDPAAAQLLQQINYLGPASLTGKLLPSLVQSGEAFVAAISGVVAEKIFPGMAAYTASKWALRGWLESLRMEGKSKGLLVVEARPGHTETGLATRVKFGKAPAMPTGMQPAHVAERILQGIEAGESTIGSELF